MNGSSRWQAAVCLLVALACNANAGGLRTDSVDVDQILAAGDFLPHIPYASDVVARYGRGKLVEDSDGRHRLYRDRTRNRWIRLGLDDGADGAVTEILISSAPLEASAPAPIRGIKSASLFKIQLGSASATVTAAFGNPRRVFREKLGHEEFQVYEFNPRPEQTDLYVRFYCRDGIVRAFSLGVTD